MSRAGLAFALALALAAPSFGATIPAYTLSELMARADVVVRVRVTASEARWLEREGPSRIVTFHEVQVLEVLRGHLTDAEAARGALTVGAPGGVVGDVGQWVPGAPQLAAGERYVLLLGRALGPAGARGVAGLSLGVIPAGPARSPERHRELRDALRGLGASAP